MKVPISWLREWVDFDATPPELAERLTFSGTEVEAVETIGCECPGLVVGEVLSVSKHPNADRLRLCNVKAGGREYRVVCGADNFAPGDKAAFAPAGVKLPNGMAIRETKIRGERSEGMLCAEDEIGLSKDHSGILVLPADSAVGAPLSEVIGPPDTVLTLEITWNRPDCLSILGMAREVAALFHSGVRRPSVELPEDDGPAVSSSVWVEVADAAGCPRYTARLIDGVKPGPSPAWMQKRLSLCGVRPISNVVDVTNYVMLETGHPLHAFDFGLLADHRIVVRRFREGEAFSTLDGIERRLTSDMLVIADGRRPVALAGIMGGAGSEISDSTRCVLLESACFDPALIHRTSLALGLATESSYRFERGVDVGAVEWAGRRAAALIAQVASARVLPGVVDAWPAPRPERTVAFRHERARRLLGMAITDEEAAGIFERLGMKVGGKAAGSCVVTVPSFRGDIEIEADLIEEVARIHGLAGIPSAIVKPVLVAGADDSFERSVAACRGAAAALGFSEIVNYSFISAGLANLFGGSGEGGRVDLPNPVSADYSVMRGSLVPQMVETMGRNVSRQVMDLAFFEMGRVFRGAGNRVCEDDRICLGLTGKGGRSNGDMRTPVSPEEAFLWIKGAVESLSAALKAGDFRFVVRDAPWAEPGWCAGVEVEGAAIGVVGLVSRDIRHRWRLSEPVAVAELPVSPLVSNLFSPRPLKPVPVFPGVARDVAVVAPDSMRHERIVEVMRAAAPSELTDIRLFDTFRSESLGLGKRSLAYTLVYRSAERTLTDEEANAFHDTVKGALREELKVEIREN